MGRHNCNIVTAQVIAFNPKSSPQLDGTERPVPLQMPTGPLVSTEVGELSKVFTERRIPHASQEPESNVFARMLLGDECSHLCCPSFSEVQHVLQGLSMKKRRVSLSLSNEPIEFSFSIVEEGLQISRYSVGEVPEIDVWNRIMHWSEVNRIFNDVANALPQNFHGSQTKMSGILRQGGALVEPLRHKNIGFGFSLGLPGLLEERTTEVSDVYSLFLEGQIWVWNSGRKIFFGKCMPFWVVKQLVHAASVLVDASREEKMVNFRLRAMGIPLGLRRDKTGEVTLKVGLDREGFILKSPSANELAESVTQLATDLLKTMSQTHRGYLKNIRFTALRDEVRTLKRWLNRKEHSLSVEQGPVSEASMRDIPEKNDLTSQDVSSPQKVAFIPKWTMDCDGIIPEKCYMAGQEWVIPFQNKIVALDHNDGKVAWIRTEEARESFVVGQTLVRLGVNNTIGFISTKDGEEIASHRLQHAPPTKIHYAHAVQRGLPPLLLMNETESTITAFDLRTGQPWWRRPLRHGAAVRACVVSKKLLVVMASDGICLGLSVEDGAVVWKHHTEQNHRGRPFVDDEVMTWVHGVQGAVALHAVDVKTGAELLEKRIEGLGSLQLLGRSGRRLYLQTLGMQGMLLCVDLEGKTVWKVSHRSLPGQAKLVGDFIVVNTQHGHMIAFSSEDGRELWRRELGKHLLFEESGNVQHEPKFAIHQGMIFVPGAGVSVLRLSDGNPVSLPLGRYPTGSKAIVEHLWLDEKGTCVFVDDAARISAYALGPQLHLL